MSASTKDLTRERTAAQLACLPTAEVADYVGMLASALRLVDWTITVDFTSLPEDDAIATMCPDGNSRHATMVLGESFWKLNATLMRQTLIHEMVHCHLFALQETCEDVVEVALTGKAFDLANVLVLNDVERATDALADAFAPLLPPLVVPEFRSAADEPKADPAPLAPDTEPLRDDDPVPASSLR